MNKVILIGRVSNEPEFFDNGKFKNSKINIAVSEKFNDNEKTYFIPCVA
jgi:single-stranded DNA-binding protein